jgi:hypothetical protein
VIPAHLRVDPPGEAAIIVDVAFEGVRALQDDLERNPGIGSS